MSDLPLAIISKPYGSLRFSRLNAPLIEFHGLFHRKEKEVPFHLVGEGLIKDNSSWKVAFDAHFFDKEEIGAFFSLTSKGGGKFIFEGEGKSLAPDQLSLFQHFVGMHIPAVEKVTIAQGIFDVKAVGWIEDKKLTRCEITDFKAAQVEGSIHKREGVPAPTPFRLKRFQTLFLNFEESRA